MMTGLALLTAGTLAFGQQAQERVSVLPAETTLAVGETVELSATVRDPAGSSASQAAIFWLTTTPEVVTVDQQGRVTAVGSGEARVGARSGNTVGFARITVLPAPPETLRATVPTPDLPAGFSIPIAVTPMDRNGERMRDVELRFQSANPSVATVDAEGRIWAMAEGETSVTVSSGPASAVVEVSVTPRFEGGGLALEPSDATVRTGDVVRFRVSGVEAYPAWSVDGAGAEISPE
ncbi:MAG: Ig-like domain-containing protein, partial [Gemmatimonadetes bacterium]|nr:Ig-like domain-containing protein [Gemmatimonadota bacterium]